MTPNNPRLALLAAALSAPLLLAGGSARACEMTEIAQLTVEMHGNQPVIPSEINGHKVLLLIDTGSGNNTLLMSQAERIGAKGVTLNGVEMLGVGGRSNVNSTVIRDLKLGGLAMQNVPMLVAGESESIGKDVVGVIGASLFQRFDVEFDLSAGVIRFFTPKDCKKDVLAYWGGAYSVAALKPQPNDYPEFEVQVALNGRKMDAVLDTGAAASVATTDAADRANVKRVEPPGQGNKSGGGFGKERVKTWLATFDTFSIGEETIKNAKLPVADLFGADAQVETGSRVASRPEDTPSMLLGADFFRSHRVLISNSQKKVYFSYKGGPVFQLDRATAKAVEAKPAETKPAEKP